MRDIAAEMYARNKAERSRQEKVDRIMCKPGYTWNETVKKCLPPSGYGAEGMQNPEYQQQKPNNSANQPQIPDVPGNIPNSAGIEVAKAAYSRKS